MFNPIEAIESSHPVRATRVVSDGGWYSTGHGSYKMRESDWRQVEHEQARRERQRLIRRGNIVPAHRMKPQLMIQTETGDWIPQIVRYN